MRWWWTTILSGALACSPISAPDLSSGDAALDVVATADHGGDGTAEDGATDALQDALPERGGFQLTGANVKGALVGGKLRAGEDYEVEYSVRVWSGTACADCDGHIVVEIGGTLLSECAFSGVPEVYPGSVTSASLGFTAPTDPGPVPIRAALVDAKDCQAATEAVASGEAEATQVGSLEVAEPFRVLSVSPTADSAGVSVKTAITLQFSGTLAVDYQPPTLSSVFGAVEGDWFAAGDTLTFTPDEPLIEFATAYELNVEPGTVTDFYGQVSPGFTAYFTTELVQKEANYQLRTDDGRVLAPMETAPTYGSPLTALPKDIVSANKGWNLVNVGNGAFQIRSGPYAVEGGGVGDGESAILAEPGPFTGQHWRAIPNGQGFILLNANTGESNSLRYDPKTELVRMLPREDNVNDRWSLTVE